MKWAEKEKRRNVKKRREVKRGEGKKQGGSERVVEHK